ncbi:MAG: TolC family protein, partial [FCB group bacterium]
IGFSLHAETRKITLDSALYIAVENNYDISTSQLSYGKSKALVKEAVGTILPSVSINANYTRNIKPPVTFLPGYFLQEPNVEFVGIPFGAKNNYQAVASVNQILFNSAVFTGLGTAKIYENASYEMYISSVSKIILNTKKAFYGVLLAKELWNTMKISLDKSEDNLKSVSALFNEGMIPEYDFIRAKVGVENLKPSVLQAENGYINALNALKMFMALDINDSIEIEGELKSFVKEGNFTEDELLNKSIQNNYDLKSLAIQKNVAEDFVTIRKSEYYPTLSAFYNYMFNGLSNKFNFINAQSSSFGLNLSMSIFQGFQSQARVEQANIDYLTLKDRYSQLKDALRLQITSALLQLTTAKERMKAQDENVSQAERGSEISRIRYKEGVGSQVEINDADVALIQASINRSQSVFDYLSAYADLDNLTGNVENRYIKMKKD